MTTTSAIDLHVERPVCPPDLDPVAPNPIATPTSPPLGPLVTPTSRAPQTQMRARARRLVQALVEVIDGDRPAIQLLRMATDTVYDDIVSRLDSLARLSTRSAQGGAPSTQVASVHVEQPQHDCAEISARIVQGSRSRAIALRLDLVEDRWVCSAILWG